MPYYKRRVTYEDFAPHITEFRNFLRRNCPVVEPYHDGYESFLVDRTQSEEVRHMYNSHYNPLVINHFAELIPFEFDHYLFTFTPKADGPYPTIAPKHIRIPKLHYLITLTPHDFFTLFRLLAASKTSSTRDSISIDFGSENITSLTSSPIYPFFTLLRTNYRMNTKYADTKWTPRPLIERIAQLQPTLTNQMRACQLLAAQEPDSLFLPLDAAVDLELEINQVDEDYCEAPNQKNAANLPFEPLT